MAVLIAACTADAMIPVPEPEPDPDPDPLGLGVCPERSDIAGICDGGGHTRTRRIPAKFMWEFKYIFIII